MKLRKHNLVVLSLLLTLPGGAVEPPLPGEDGYRPPSADFQPLLQPGDELPPGAAAPLLPESPAGATAELFPDGVSPPEGLVPTVNPGLRLLPPARLPLPPGTEPLPDQLPLPLPPEDPPAIPGMELATRSVWHKNPREARDLAVRERKPLLIFFRQKWKPAPMPALAGGQANAVDLNVALNDDLLTTPEFNEFASRIVLTSIRYPVGTVDKEEYPPSRLAAMKRFKEHFDVKGFPHIILLDPKGRVMERVSGYRRIRERGVEVSTAQPILDRLKRAVSAFESAQADEDERLNRLTAQGFREWTSRSNAKLFARLVSSNSGTVVLMEENGGFKKVPMDLLSIVDKAWLHRQSRPKKK